MPPATSSSPPVMLCGPLCDPVLPQPQRTLHIAVPHQRRDPLQVLPFRLRCAVFPTANSDLRNAQHDRRVHHSEVVGLAPRTQRILALPATQFLLHGMRSRLHCQHCCDPPFLVFVVSTSDRRIPFWGRIFSPPFSLSDRLVVPTFPQA